MVEIDIGTIVSGLKKELPFSSVNAFVPVFGININNIIISKYELIGNYIL